MPLIKLTLKPGVNRENTRYTNEGGYYESDKIRFRQGTPETIGGWTQISENRFLGVCRSLWNWVTLVGAKLLGVGTHLKYYIELGGEYYDITPIRDTTVAGSVTFAATSGSSVITVTNIDHGCVVGDFVTFFDAVSLGGAITAPVLNQEYQVVSFISDDSYTINVGVNANGSDSGDGGVDTYAEYQINVGPEIQVPLVGWGASAWSSGEWGIGTPATIQLRLWSESNYGEDLIFGPRGGGIYYWDASSGVGQRGVNLDTLSGASDVPVVQNLIFVSDVARFVITMGCNELGETAIDPLLIRWSAQEDAADWTPSATNQAGGLRLSQGSEIISAIQSRQEIVVFTDVAVYSFQYLGPPLVWGAQLLAEGMSVIGPNAVGMAAGVTYWMGLDKFYIYDGNVKTLSCDLRQYVFSDINLSQRYQVFAAVNEGFNEVWWFYCSANSTRVDKYVVYNYVENIWYYGTMARTAWVDAEVNTTPTAATYTYNLVSHEDGVDDVETGTPQPINAYIETSEFDVGDGNNFIFIRRVLPDITFRTSTNGTTPQATLTLKPMKNSGSGYNNPLSVGGNSSANIVRIAQAPIEEFTGQVFIRVRGRQFVMRLESDRIGTAWQMGAMRVDVKIDGERG
jgi:hypothetical protein